MVSEDSDRFARIIGPALKQVDYCILNEVEASKVTGAVVRENGILLNEGIEQAAEKLFELGVHELVAIHFPEDPSPNQVRAKRSGMDHLALPKEYVKGQPVREMPFVPECCLVSMRVGPSKNAS